MVNKVALSMTLNHLVAYLGTSSLDWLRKDMVL